MQFPRIPSDDGQWSRISPAAALAGGRQKKPQVSETMTSKWCPCGRALSILLCFTPSHLKPNLIRPPETASYSFPGCSTVRPQMLICTTCCATAATESHNLNTKVDNSSSNSQELIFLRFSLILPLVSICKMGIM